MDFVGKKQVRPRTDASGGETIGPVRSTPKVEKKTRSRARSNAEKDASEEKPVTKAKGRKVKKEPKLDVTIAAGGGYEFEIDDPDSIERGKLFK